MSNESPVPKRTHLQLAQERFQRYIRKPFLRLLHPRRFHAYCVGTSKSGTHSVGIMLEDHYRSRHEPKERETIRFSLASAADRLSQERQREFLLKRDRHMWLEMDASNLNLELIRMQVALFPKAKFILTVRECLSWVDSEINHRLGRPVEVKEWFEMWDLRYGAERFEYAPEEWLLKEHGLHTLDGYLSFWARHQQTVLDVVPADRLLVIMTREISNSTQKIADFLGIQESTMNVNRSHSFGAAKKFNILAKLDRDFVLGKARQHCQAIMDRLFPESDELKL